MTTFQGSFEQGDRFSNITLPIVHDLTRIPDCFQILEVRCDTHYCTQLSLFDQLPDRIQVLSISDTGKDTNNSHWSTTHAPYGCDRSCSGPSGHVSVQLPFLDHPLGIL